MRPELRTHLEVLRDGPPGPGRQEAVKSLEEALKAAEFERETLLKSLERASTELEGRVQELSLLRRISEVMADTFDNDELATKILAVLRDEQEIQDAALWIAEGEDLLWRSGIGYGVPDPGTPQSVERAAELGEGLLGQTATRREALVVHDALVEARCKNAEPFLRRGSFCLFPLLSAGRLVGMLWLGSPDRYAFPTERLRVLTMAAQEIAQGLAGSELFTRLSRFSESLTDVIAARTLDLEQKSEEIERFRSAWARFERSLQIGEVTSSLDPLPGSERMHQAIQALRATCATTDPARSSTLGSAITLMESFCRDYDQYVQGAPAPAGVKSRAA